jgi:LuxR family maltose regulon positive regulatory protein
VSTPTDTTTTLAAGWEALARTEWDRARTLFEAAVARDGSAEALEGLSLAAWWLDDAETMFSTRERAYRLYRRDGDLRSAGRVATLFGIDYYSFRGEAAIGNGWFRRAHRLLDELPPVPEQGWLWIWEGQIRLLADNDPATARRLGHEAAELGRALGDLDIEGTALGLEGLAAVTEGDLGEGMAKLDEATATAVSGDMSEPIGIGATCCYLIFACERVRDFDRAVQWCERLEELCRQWRWGSMFSTCRTHHAGVLLWQGAWQEAEAKLEEATRELEASRPGKVADGLLRLAELRRRQGRLDEAERLLERVSFSPHALFGLAALALDRDRAADALDLVDRFVRQIPQENRTDRAAARAASTRPSGFWSASASPRTRCSDSRRWRWIATGRPMRSTSSTASCARSRRRIAPTAPPPSSSRCGPTRRWARSTPAALRSPSWSRSPKPSPRIRCGRPPRSRAECSPVPTARTR